MKTLVSVMLAVLVIACNSVSGATAPSPSPLGPEHNRPAPIPSSAPSPAHPARRYCAPSADPMACLRTNCGAAGGYFNEEQKRCECPEGKILNTAFGFECSSVPEIQVDADISAFGVGKEIFESKDAYTLRTFVSQNAPAMAFLPVRGIQVISASTRDLLNSEDAKNILGIPQRTLQTTNLMNQPDLNLSFMMNGGVQDAARQFNYLNQFAFLPRDSKVTSGTPDLDSVIAQSLDAARRVSGREDILVYNDAGCIDQCIARSLLLDTSRYRVTRARMYFQGGVVDDHLSVFDKQSLNTAATLYLINGRLSHWILQEADQTWLHGNEASLEASRIVSLQRFPNPGEAVDYQLDLADVPVAIFETAKNPQLDTAVPRGPWKESHIYGWFKKEDQVPFFKNYQQLNTQFGEEDVQTGTAGGHAINIATLASARYQHPVIPFQDTDLLSGLYATFANNYFVKQGDSNPARARMGLVASVSETLSMSASACAQSPIGTSILRDHGTSTLWSIAAGNSHTELNAWTPACPQTLQGRNILKVASSPDGQSLSPSSTYGSKSVDIVELGCPSVDSESCNPADAETSWAAPRLARKLADLMRGFPQATAQQIRFAVLVTARAPEAMCEPYYFRRTCSLGRLLPVRSGGVADAKAAARLLAGLSQWPRTPDLTSDAWVKLIAQAKADQYVDLWLEPGEGEKLTRMQLNYFLANQGGL